jgi:hypothetical protein
MLLFTILCLIQYLSEPLPARHHNEIAFISWLVPSKSQTAIQYVVNGAAVVDDL